MLVSSRVNMESRQRRVAQTSKLTLLETTSVYITFFVYLEPVGKWAKVSTSAKASGCGLRNNPSPSHASDTRKDTTNNAVNGLFLTQGDAIQWILTQLSSIFYLSSNEPRSYKQLWLFSFSVVGKIVTNFLLRILSTLSFVKTDIFCGIVSDGFRVTLILIALNNPWHSYSRFSGHKRINHNFLV